jgi:hypothetical protein
MATEKEIAEGIKLFQAELDRTAPAIAQVLSEPLPGETPAPAVIPLTVYSIRQAILEMPSNKARVEAGEAPLVPHGVSDDNLALIEGPQGILVYCTEGVGWRRKSLDDEFAIGLEPQEPDGKKAIYMFPTHRIKMTLAQIKEHGVPRQVEMKDFVRVFGARLEDNFRLMQEAIAKIGLNPDDYYKGGRPPYER